MRTIEKVISFAVNSLFNEGMDYAKALHLVNGCHRDAEENWSRTQFDIWVNDAITTHGATLADYKAASRALIAVTPKDLGL
jgi:hypothetical protein